MVWVQREFKGHLIHPPCNEHGHCTPFLQPRHTWAFLRPSTCRRQSPKSSERGECLLSTESKLHLLLGEACQVLDLSKVIPTPHSPHLLCTYLYANTFSSHTCFCAYVSQLVSICHLCKTLLAKKYKVNRVCVTSEAGRLNFDEQGFLSIAKRLVAQGSILRTDRFHWGVQNTTNWWGRHWQDQVWKVPLLEKAIRKRCLRPLGDTSFRLIQPR